MPPPSKRKRQSRLNLKIAQMAKRKKVADDGSGLDESVTVTVSKNVEPVVKNNPKRKQSALEFCIICCNKGNISKTTDNSTLPSSSMALRTKAEVAQAAKSFVVEEVLELEENVLKDLEKKYPQFTTFSSAINLCSRCSSLSSEVTKARREILRLEKITQENTEKLKDIFDKKRNIVLDPLPDGEHYTMGRLFRKLRGQDEGDEVNEDGNGELETVKEEFVDPEENCHFSPEEHYFEEEIIDEDYCEGEKKFEVQSEEVNIDNLAVVKEEEEDVQPESESESPIEEKGPEKKKMNTICNTITRRFLAEDDEEQPPKKKKNYGKRSTFPCYICPEILKTLDDAKIHRKYLHRGLSVCLGVVGGLGCRQIFRSTQMKRHRMEAHPIFSCAHCPETFSSFFKRNSHHFYAHDSLTPPPEEEDRKLVPWVAPLTPQEILGRTGSNTKTINIKLTKPTSCRNSNSVGCIFCRKEFPSFPLWQQHVHNEHKLEEATPSKEGRNQNSPFLCQECFQKFKTLPELEDHLEEKHSHQNNQNEENDIFPCLEPGCNCVIKGRDNLKLHVESVHVLNNPVDSTILSTTADGTLRETRCKSYKKKRPNSGNNEKNEIVKPEIAKQIGGMQKPKKILFNCGLCNEKFLSEESLLSHFRDKHSDEKQEGKRKQLYKCFICKTEFFSLAHCQNHIQYSHNQEKKKKKLKQIPQPQGKKTIAAKRPFVCKPCGQRFKTILALQDHMKSEEHAIGPDIPCLEPGCNLIIKGKINMKIHVENVHVQNNPVDYSIVALIKCPNLNCKKTFETKNSLDSHLFGQIKGQCRESAGLLKGDYPCPKCKASYKLEYLLTRHLLLHEKKTFQCPECPQKFHFQGMLTTHINKVHRRRLGPPGMCDVCGKSFQNAVRLRVHKESHRTDRRFLCPTCGKTFKTSTSLSIHKYSHDPERWTKHYPYRIMMERKLAREKLKSEKKRNAGRTSENVSAEAENIPVVVSPSIPENLIL